MKLAIFTIVLLVGCSTPPVQVDSPPPFGWQQYPTTRPLQWFSPMFDTRQPAGPL